MAEPRNNFTAANEAQLPQTLCLRWWISARFLSRFPRDLITARYWILAMFANTTEALIVRTQRNILRCIIYVVSLQHWQNFGPSLENAPIGVRLTLAWQQWKKKWKQCTQPECSWIFELRKALFNMFFQRFVCLLDPYSVPSIFKIFLNSPRSLFDCYRS